MSRGRFALIQQVSRSSPHRLEVTPLNFYRRFPGDYARDTKHLTLVEHGVYTLLLDYYYSTEKPIPSLEFAYALCGARHATHFQAVRTVLKNFFVRTTHGYKNKRAEEELKHLEGKRESAKNSAKARWGASGRNANASANASQTQYGKDANAHDERNALQTLDSRRQTSQDHLVAAGVEAQTAEAAAAVKAVFDEIQTEPFGPWDFQSIFANAVKNGAKSWVDAMERTIQVCKASGVSVPGRFYSIKHVLEKLDAEQSFKRRPM